MVSWCLNKLTANSSPPTPMARVGCNSSLVRARRHCARWSFPLLAYSWDKIDYSKNISIRTHDDGQSQGDRTDTDLNTDDDEVMIGVQRDILLQESQLLGQLSETDEILGISRDSFTGTSATEKLENLTLGSEDEHEITVISVRAQSLEKNSSVEAGSERGGGSTNTEGHSSNSGLVRQDAVTLEATTDDVSRTKEEKARSGVRASLYYLNKIAKRGPLPLTGKDKYLTRKHRRNVKRFERIYGPVCASLGMSYPEGLDVDAGNTPEVSRESTGGKPTSSPIPTGAEVSGSGKPVKPAVLVKQQVTSGKPATTIEMVGHTPSSKPGNQQKVVRDARPGDDLPSTSKKTSLSKPVSSSSGAVRASNVKPSTSKNAGQNPSGSLKSPRKGVVKRARSGDDQQPSMAKKVVHTPNSSSKGHHKEVIKRAVSGSEQPSTSKRAKESVLQNCIQAAVIDRVDPDGRISVEQWRQIEHKLIEEIALVKGRPDEVSFKGADWMKGVKTINCGNEKSFEFLRNAVARCDTLYPGAKLEVILASELPLRPIVTAWFPPPVLEVGTILTVLENQNKGLLTSQWKLVNTMTCKENQGRDFRFAVDQESLKKLESLGGVVNFGFGVIRFRYNKSDKPKEAVSGAN